MTNAPGTTATEQVPGADHRLALPAAPPNGRDLDQGTNLNLKRDLTHLENLVLSSREDRANSEINVTICTIPTQQPLPKTKTQRKIEIGTGLGLTRESLGTDLNGDEVGEEAKNAVLVTEERVEKGVDPADRVDLAGPANQANLAEIGNLAVRMTPPRNTKININTNEIHGERLPHPLPLS